MLFFQNLPFLGLLSLLLATSPFTSASVPEDVIGLWRGNESILWIERVGTTLEAVIIAIRPIELAYHEVEEAPWPTGTPRTEAPTGVDKHHTIFRFRSFVVGTEIFLAFHK